MTNGLGSAKLVHDVPHPLIVSESNVSLNKRLNLVAFMENLFFQYVKNRNEMNMAVLRSSQGLHAPLKIAMELKAANKVGRLPFMQSSNIMRDVLTGRDVEMGFEDVLNTGEFQEVAGQPHAMVEKSLGIL